MMLGVGIENVSPAKESQDGVESAAGVLTGADPNPPPIPVATEKFPTSHFRRKTAELDERDADC